MTNPIHAVVTGGTKGIGLAITELFLSKGIHVFICARNLEDLNAKEKELNDKYPNSRLWAAQVDMSDKESVFHFAQEIELKMDNVDILVNNAGIFIPGAIADEAEGALENMMETNLYSAYHLTRKLLPSMKLRNKGHIFNMNSIASKIAYPNGGSYSISKFALLGFTKVLREELKEDNISVTAIMPGATWSNSWAGVDLPDDRLMQAKDIAKAVYNAWEISPSAVVEEIVIRPQLGDL